MTGSFSVILPITILVGGAFAIILLAILFRLKNSTEALLTTFILAAGMIALIRLASGVPNPDQLAIPFFGVLQTEGIILRTNYPGIFIVSTAMLIGIIICIYSGEYLNRDHRYFLYYPLILLVMAGLVGLFFSTDLFNLFLLVELTTIGTSALIAFRYKQEEAVKAGFRYLIMSSLGTMIMLLGVYFTYRSSGSLSLESGMDPDKFTRVGAGCFLVGFWIKAGVVPLHTWVPDVYSKAPSAVTGLLAGVLSKSMLFIAPGICLRLGMTPGELGLYYVIFAFMNMLLGSIRTLNQTSMRRFLAYSSIAHTGYLMFTLGIGFLYGLDSAFSAGLFLFLSVAVMKSLAFLAVGIYEYYLRTSDIEILQGLPLMPLPAVTFSFALAGLAGIPLLAGFNGKWLVFSSALTIREPFVFLGLGVFLLSSVISLGGYLPMLARQYQRTTPQLPALSVGTDQAMNLWITIPVLVLTAMVLLLGIFPTPWLSLIERIMDWIRIL